MRLLGIYTQSAKEKMRTASNLLMYKYLNYDWLQWKIQIVSWVSKFMVGMLLKGAANRTDTWNHITLWYNLKLLSFCFAALIADQVETKYKEMRRKKRMAELASDIWSDWHQAQANRQPSRYKDILNYRQPSSKSSWAHALLCSAGARLIQLPSILVTTDSSLLPHRQAMLKDK